MQIMRKGRSTNDAFDMFDVLRQNYRCQSQLNEQLQRIGRERTRASERIRRQRDAVHRELLENLAYLQVYRRYNFQTLQATVEADDAGTKTLGPIAAAALEKGHIGGVKQAAAASSATPPRRTRAPPPKATRLSSEPVSDPFHLKDINRYLDDDLLFREPLVKKKTAFSTAASEMTPAYRSVAPLPTKKVPSALKFPAIWKSRNKTFYEKKKQKLLTEWLSPARTEKGEANQQEPLLDEKQSGD